MPSERSHRDLSKERIVNLRAALLDFDDFGLSRVTTWLNRVLGKSSYSFLVLRLNDS